jgi:hypothetical protein
MGIARSFSLLFFAGVSTIVTRAAAQDQPLPPLPSQQPQYAPQQPPPPYYQQPPPPPPYYQQGYGPPPQYYAPQPYYQGPRAEPLEEPVHAPKFSLWTGVRLGYMGFGGGFYGVPTDLNGNSTTESTGNLVSNGPTVQLDIGARLGKRYIPFAFWEHSFLRPGHRFEGNSNASAYSELYGAGLRYTAGDVDTAGFLTELTVGWRTVAVSDGSSTYKLQAIEFFKLGLGAEIRITTLFVLSPLASISTGTMTDTSGTTTFQNSVGPASVAGTAPPFKNGGSVDDSRGYVSVSLTLGAHFDVFGK